MFSLFGKSKVLSFKILFSNKNEVSVHVKPEFQTLDLFEYSRFWAYYSSKILWNLGFSEERNPYVSKYLESIQRIACDDFKNKIDCFKIAGLKDDISYVNHCYSIISQYEGSFYKKGNDRFIITKFPLKITEDQVIFSGIAILQYIINITKGNNNLKMLKNITNNFSIACDKQGKMKNMNAIDITANFSCFMAKEVLDSDESLFRNFIEELNECAKTNSEAMHHLISKDTERENESPISYGQDISVYTQYIFFFLHILKRMLQESNNCDQEEIINKLLTDSITIVSSEMQEYSRRTWSKEESEKMIEHLSKDFYFENEKYSMFINRIPDTDEPATGTLFWEFGRDVANILGKKEDFFVIQGSQTLALRSFKWINIPLFIYNLTN